jgi:DNA-binding response OmpR family regulator
MILFIEDDKLLASILIEKCKKEGLEILHVLDGENGFRAASEKKPDLILLDLLLPGIDGFEVLKRLKENLATKDIPVFVLSNLGEEEEKRQVMKMGAEDFLIKAHFDLVQIVSKIKERLAKKKQED